MKFEEKLQKLRKEKGMSQENLAELLDVSRQSVSKWESGQSYPETEKLIALSDIFGVTLDSFIKDGELEQDGNNIASELFWQRRGSYYEYKSERKLFGVPLVHINVGMGRKAKGIIAVGFAAKGFLSFGVFSAGLLSFGAFSAGVICFGALGLGLLLSMGAVVVGTVAIGAVAIGIFTIGAVSIGMFSLGAASFATHVAIGDFARGHIAIGRNAAGKNVIEVDDINRAFTEISREQVGTMLDAEFPNMWNWVKSIVKWGFK
ncbi:MAG: helix-turn-helix domain-containing protein [Oscillospiraceae bacterium]|nr:helix-turn-helix domain-containing protein [Oscillospiraceae bacterium]